MNKYDIYGSIRASSFLGTVTAENAIEAEEKAWDELDCSVSLCHQCSTEAEDPEVVSLEVVKK